MTKFLPDLYQLSAFLIFFALDLPLTRMISTQQQRNNIMIITKSIQRLRVESDLLSVQASQLQSEAPLVEIGCAELHDTVDSGPWILLSNVRSFSYDM